MHNNATFKDIGGYKYPKQEAAKIANYFQNYKEFNAKGAKLYRGILFFGPCGTGKTLFAHAIANESKVPLFELTSEAFYKEQSIAMAIKSTFDEAKKAAPCILLIDELDRIVFCDRRYNSQESDKQREALRALLTEIDSAVDSGVLIIATANTHVNAVPPALVRNGRIEKHIEINLPNKSERTDILNHYLKDKPIFKNIDPKEIASYTARFSCSALSSLVNDVLINCISKGDEEASFKDFLEPIQVIRNHGIRREANMDKQKPIIMHEIGHFLADYHLNKRIGMLTVVPYGDSEGNYSIVEDDNFSLDCSSYRELKNHAIVSIAGLIGDEVFLGERYLGSSSDISKVRDIFFEMAANGLIDYESSANTILNNDRYGTSFGDYELTTQKEFTAFLNEVSLEAARILEKYKDLAKILGNELSLKPCLTKNDIIDLLVANNFEVTTEVSFN